MRPLKDILDGFDTEVEHQSTTVREKTNIFEGVSLARQGKKSFVKKATQSVVRSMEFRRIEALPRRILDLISVVDATEVFAKPGGTGDPGSAMRLLPAQSAALVEMAHLNGAFIPLAAGYGKTAISLLAPLALDSQNAVLIVPTQLKRKTLHEMHHVYGKHFNIPFDVITVLTYEEISLAKNADILYQIKPDLIVCDEVHKLRHRSAARTKRFMRFMKDHPQTRFVAMSGTITSKGLNDYAHLIELALRKFSPLPHNYREVQEWAGALDVDPEWPMLPGALKRFCALGEDVRSGFRRRLVETPGVISSTSEMGDATLTMVELDLPLPDQVFTLMTQVKKKWSLAGDEFDSIFTLYSSLRQLACGFYYKWAWPEGKVDREWLQLRSNWNKVVRAKLAQSRPGLDSVALCANAAERARKSRFSPVGEGALWHCPEWDAWREVKDRPEPPKETIWVDDFLLKDVIARAQVAEAPCIVWYEHVAVGEKLAELTGWSHYGSGTDSLEALKKKEQIIICSMKTQSEGKNLQEHFAYNIFTSFPSSAALFEQAIGRTHRQGQVRDEVVGLWYGHTDETRASMDNALREAEYKRDTMGSPQRILYCDRIKESDLEKVKT